MAGFVACARVGPCAPILRQFLKPAGREPLRYDEATATLLLEGFTVEILWDGHWHNVNRLIVGYVERGSLYDLI